MDSLLSSKPIAPEVWDEYREDKLPRNDKQFIEPDIDRSGQALSGFIKYRSYIDSYNAAISNDIPNAVVRLTSAKFWDAEGNAYLLRLGPDIHTAPPVFGNTNISPYTALIKNIPYMGSFYGKVELLKYNPDGTLMTISEAPNTKLFELPAMLGSNLCNLYDPQRKGLKPEFIDQYAADPLGYFIIHGERVIYNLENLRYSRILCYMGKKDEIKSVMTCNIVTRTSQVAVFAQPSKKGVGKAKAPPKGYFHPYVYGLHLKMFGTNYDTTKSASNNKNTIPAFMLHFAFGLTIEDIKSIIYRHIPDQNKELVYNRLLKTLDISINESTNVWPYLARMSNEAKLDKDENDLLEKITKDIEELENKFNLGTITDTELITKNSLEGQRKQLVEKLYHQIYDRVNFYLFPQMNELQFPDVHTEDERWRRIELFKLELLTIMIIEPARIQVGYRKLDDRDDMLNKRVQGPGRSLHTLVATGWQSQVIDETITQIKANPYNRNPQEEFDGLLKSIRKSSGQLATEFVLAMTSGNWCTSRHRLSRTDATTTLNRAQNNLFALISLILKVVINQNKRSRAIGPRDVHPGSFGGYCPFQSPDTSRVGQRKYLSILARISPTGTTSGHFELLRNDISYVYRPGLYPLLFNGMFIGWVDPLPTAQKLKQARRQEISPSIDPETLVLVYNSKVIVSTDPERIVRPLFRVNPETNRVKIVEYAETDPNIWNATPGEMLSKGLIEYLDQGEINMSVYVGESIESLNDIVKRLENARVLVEMQQPNTPAYDAAKANLERLEAEGIPSHVEIDPMAVLGTAASTVFGLNMNQAPRAALQAKMGEKAMGPSPIIYMGEKETKTLCYPTVPIATTHVAKALGIDQAPVGRSVTMAILTDEFAQEDSFIFSQALVDSHALDYTVVNRVDILTKDKKANKFNLQLGPMITPPDPNEAHLYHAVDLRTGLPIIGSYVKSGDVLCIVQVTNYETNSRPESKPYIVDIWNEGYIWNWYTQQNTKDASETLHVTIKQIRSPRAGDKYNFKPAQKGTVSQIRAQEEMPFEIKSGQVVDVIFNPHAIPSRGTLSLLVENISGRNAVLEGKANYGPSYRAPRNLEEIMNKLKSYGYESKGFQTLIDGRTGERIQARIFTGIAQIHALPHNPIDKVKGASLRSLSKVNTETRSMRSGRDTGAKIGEMSRWAVIGHGANEIFNEIACKMPAPSLNAFCTICGKLAIPRTVELDNRVNIDFTCPRCGKAGEFGQTLINHSVIYTQQLLTMFGLNISFDLQHSNQTLKRG